MKTVHCLGCLLFLFCKLLWAVPQFTDTAQVMRHYDYRAGLSQVTVMALAQDQFGYIWIGTQAGLNRFDGHEFKTFASQQQNVKSLAGGFITELCVSNDKVWVGTSTGLSVYHTVEGRFTSLLASEFPVIGSDRVNWIDCKGEHVVVSTEDNTSYEVDKATLVPQALKIEGSYIRNVVQRGDNYFYLSNEGFMVYHKQAQTSVQLLSGEFKHMIYQGQRAMLISKSDRLISYDTLYQRVLWSRNFDAVQNITLHSLAITGNELLVASDNGVYLLDLQGKLLNHWYKRDRQHEGLQDNNILTVMRDKNQDLWIGTETRGLHFFSQLSESFGHVSEYNYPSAPIKSADIRNFAIDRNDRIWLATSNGVHIFDGKGFNGAHDLYPLLKVLDGSFVTRILFDDDHLWATTRGNGVVSFNLKTKKLLHLKPDIGNGPELSFNDVFLFKNRVLVSSRTMGAMYFDATSETLKSLYTNEQNAPSHVSSMSVVNGELWFGSIGNGLYRDIDGKLENLTTAEGLVSDLVFMLEQDQYGRVWVASESGLSLVTKEFTVERVFTQQSGLANNAIWGLVFDNLNHLWVGSSGGLSQINTNNFEIYNFSPVDGVQGNEFNYNAAWLAPDGRVFIGGAMGFNQFYPQKLRLDNSASPLLISHIELLGKSLTPSDEGLLKTAPELAESLLLKYDQDIVSLQYSSLDYGSEQQQFYYRVIGLSDKWLKLAKGVRQVNLLRLDPGSYIIESYTINRFNVQSPIHRFELKIDAPWWWDIYAKTLYVLTLLALIILIVRIRQKRYRQVVADNQKMSELRQRLELSLWASGDELWDWHLDQQTIYRHCVSPRVDYGKAENHMQLDDFIQFVHPKDNILLEDKVEACIRGNVESYEIAIRVKDLSGQWAWVLDRGKVVDRDESGKAIRIAGALKDITELKTHQNALQLLNEQLEIKVEMRTNELYKQNQMLEQAMLTLKQTQQELIESEKMASLGGLVAGVAHEINTPLGVALTAMTYNQECLQVVEKKLADKTLKQNDLVKAIAEQTQGYQLILRNLDRAQNLIGNFKQVAVDQSSETSRQINLKEYVEDVFHSLEPLIKGKEITIHVSGSDTVILTTYPGAIYQILTNLLNNSVLHGFEKRGNGEVLVTVAVDESSWYVNYTDDGVGMNEEMLKTIFDPFVTSKRSQGGCGLGMHIVYNLVTQLLKGEIKCFSEEGKGIAVKLKIPIDSVKEMAS
ncbi:sensor histidine kinase [Pseudoalteromonas aurantia]|nr:two-component regulator propeller domain-containing protein [Pseudoalteromonas aurantia]